MSNENELPLASFLQMSYNQEQYIVPSLQAALAQTYTPMEIIVSDDASTDNSWQLIQDTVANYNGSHRIVVHRNEQNLGLAGNWNKLCSLAQGELLIKGDGDDISLPNRVERLVHEWLKHNKIPMLLSSSYIKIDIQGRQTGEYLLPINGWDNRDISLICKGSKFFHIGATSAYNRKLFDTFGTIMPQAADDSTYTGRAALLGRLICIQDKLVLYRDGSGNTTDKSNYRGSMIKGINLGLHSRYQLLDDLESIKGQLPLVRYEQMKDIFEHSVNQHKDSLQLWKGVTFRERFSGYKKLYEPQTSLKIKYIKLILLLPGNLSKLFLQIPLRFRKLKFKKGFDSGVRGQMILIRYFYIIKRGVRFVCDIFYFLYFKFRFGVPEVVGIDETIDKILTDRVSVSRFGDGELNLLSEIGEIGFQNKDARLAKRLIEVLNCNRPNLIVCLPNFSLLWRMKRASQFLWLYFFRVSLREWMKYIPTDRSYYNAFMTRLYILWKDKSQAAVRYEKLKRVWSGRDVLIVEGALCRIGIGNDILDSAKSVKRLLCPPENAFSVYSKILEAARKYGNNRLILIALGPTATVLAHDLAMDGYQAIDIGHFDVEYEWFLLGTKKKTALKYKYVIEVVNGSEVECLDDPIYLESIVHRIGCE